MAQGQPLEFGGKGRIAALPHGVEQRDAARGLRGDGVTQHADQRGDADAARDEHEVAWAVGGHREAAERRVNQQGVAGAHGSMERGGHDALPLHRDFQVTGCPRGRTDRVAPGDAVARYVHFDHEKLARREVEAWRARQAERADRVGLVDHREHQRPHEADGNGGVGQGSSLAIGQGVGRSCTRSVGQGSSFAIERTAGDVSGFANHDRQPRGMHDHSRGQPGGRGEHPGQRGEGRGWQRTQHAQRAARTLHVDDEHRRVNGRHERDDRRRHGETGIEHVDWLPIRLGCKAGAETRDQPAGRCRIFLDRVHRRTLAGAVVADATRERCGERAAKLDSAGVNPTRRRTNRRQRAEPGGLPTRYTEETLWRICWNA